MRTFDNIPLALTFLFLSLRAAARASARPPPAEGAEAAPPPKLDFSVTPGTAAALRSRFSWLLTRFSPLMPPLALIDAKTSSFPEVGFGRGGAVVGSRPGGSGGGGGPLPWGSGGASGAPKDGNGGGTGPAEPGKGGGGGPEECGRGGDEGAGGPLTDIGGFGTILGIEGNGRGAGADVAFRWLGSGGGNGDPAGCIGAFGVFGGRGGGAPAVAATAWRFEASRDARGDGRRGIRLGGAGGAVDVNLSP